MSEVRGLRRDYGDFVIDIPSWTIADEGVTALFGRSGAGKTSVFRLLIGLEPCPSLSWIHRGEDLARMPTPRRRLGVVFQNGELFPHLTAAENIQFAARARGLDPVATRSRFDELVEDLRMAGYLNRRAAVLSGGEVQRVALARALIGAPRFLFLDEPFSALDAEARGETRRAVAAVVNKSSVPTLLISHDPEDLRALGARRVNLVAGRLGDPAAT